MPPGSLHAPTEQPAAALSLLPLTSHQRVTHALQQQCGDCSPSLFIAYTIKLILPSSTLITLLNIVPKPMNRHRSGYCGGVHPEGVLSILLQQRVRDCLDRPDVKGRSQSWTFSQREHSVLSKRILPVPPSRCRLQVRPVQHHDRQPARPWQQGGWRTGQEAGSLRGEAAREGGRERDGCAVGLFILKSYNLFSLF